MIKSAEQEYQARGLSAAEAVVMLHWTRRDVARFSPLPVYAPPPEPVQMETELPGKDLEPGGKVPIEPVPEEPPFDPGPQPEPEPEPEYLAYAEVSHGRWIVRCPFCRSAQLASKEDHRFFCVECLNEVAGRRWVRVVWPEEPEPIEAALLARPERAFMHWRKGEPVEALLVENAADRFHHSWSENYTYTVGEVVTAAVLNTYVSDQLAETAPARGLQGILATQIFG